METQVKACININDDERMNSSSGGIYPLIATKTIKNGGVVYAAVYDDNLDVIHKKLTTLEEIPESCGSKYIASYLGDTFKNVLEDLENKRQCLFVGTPCQCVGLINFLKKKEIDRLSLHKNLTIIDFVCHGVPTTNAWHSYLNAEKKRGFDVANVNMRDKSSGWSRLSYSVTLKDKNGDIKSIGWGANRFLAGFIANLYLRPSCYNCKFKGIERQTDITLGDFWGIWDLNPKMDDNKGTSLCLIHTPKGKNLLEELESESKIKSEIIESKDYIKYNESIVKTSTMHPKSEVFLKDMASGYDFIKLVDKYTGNTFRGKVKRKLKGLIRI